MREIKFRAWDTQDERMLLPENQEFVIIPTLPDFGVDTHYCDEKRCHFDESLFDWASADLLGGRFELVQYTGLKDKNDTEIYESDILVCRSMHDSNVFCDAWESGATWNDGTTKAIPKVIEKDNEGVDWIFPCDIRYNPGYWEVIGNIYENPEVLEGGSMKGVMDD